MSANSTSNFIIRKAVNKSRITVKSITHLPSFHTFSRSSLIRTNVSPQNLNASCAKTRKATG